MAHRSKIEWTDHTFNPWWGCVKVSPGCKNCYAETLSSRYGHDCWGTSPRRLLGEVNWKQPFKWDRQARLRGRVERVFCGSMCDVLEQVTELDALRLRLWDVIQATPLLQWMLLTKRPENRGDIPDGVMRRIWFGVSVEDQRRADERIPQLLQCPAAVRFVSAEPLLEPVTFRKTWSDWLQGWDTESEAAHACGGDAERCRYLCPVAEPVQVKTNKLDLIIAGGESGPGARPADVRWFRDVRDQCREAGVAFFMKQDSGLRAGMQGRIPDDLWQCKELPDAVPAANEFSASQRNK